MNLKKLYIITLATDIYEDYINNRFQNIKGSHDKYRINQHPHIFLIQKFNTEIKAVKRI